MPLQTVAFSEEPNFWERDKTTVGAPRFGRKQRPAKYARLGAQTEESEHSNTAESNSLDRLFVPITFGRLVKNVISINQSEPDIYVEQDSLGTNFGSVRHLRH